MRIRPEETGPINWILFCPWWDMRWVWGTCGGSLTSLSKTAEVSGGKKSSEITPLKKKKKQNQKIYNIDAFHCFL